MQNGLAQKYHSWFYLSSLNWRWHLSQFFLEWTSFNGVRCIGMLMSWTCKKIPSMIFVCRFSSSLTSKTISLISFDKISIEIYLVQFAWCVKMNFCLLDQFAIGHIDGKLAVRLRLLFRYGSRQKWFLFHFQLSGARVIRTRTHQSDFVFSRLWHSSAFHLSKCSFLGFHWLILSDFFKNTTMSSRSIIIWNFSSWKNFLASCRL